MTWQCRKCGETERYKGGNCVFCMQKWAKKRYADNPDRQRKYNQLNRNPEKQKEYNRRYRQENQEQQKEYQRRWYQENKEKTKERQRHWAQENQEQQKEYHRRWRQANPDKIAAQNNRRRAHKANAASESYDFKAICKHYNNQCLACGRSDFPLTVDHIIPLTKGGDDIASNIQPLCGPCNTSKGNHHQTDYRPDKGPKHPRQIAFWPSKRS